MADHDKRPSGRACAELRDIAFERHYTRYGEGSVLSSFGNTKVLCTASIEDKVPMFLKGKNQGWLNAEYSMLPRATETRNIREVMRGKQKGTLSRDTKTYRAFVACLPGYGSTQ